MPARGEVLDGGRNLADLALAGEREAAAANGLGDEGADAVAAFGAAPQEGPAAEAEEARARGRAELRAIDASAGETTDEEWAGAFVDHVGDHALFEDEGAPMAASPAGDSLRGRNTG